MRTKNPKHREFEEQIRALGCPVTMVTNPNMLDIHHLEGRTFKNNKQLIGPFLIVPLYQDEVNLNYPGNLHERGDYSVHDFSKGPFKEQWGDIRAHCMHTLNLFLIDNKAPWTDAEWMAIEDYLK